MVITLTVINAFNFVDGIDGLAASMALIALVAGGLASGLSGSPAAIAVIACGAILGFLPFNFPGNPNSRIRTFMGDAGSTLLGFIVVWFTIAISQGDNRSLSPVAALWFALMPLSDFFYCVARRAAKRKLPLHPGREHFHYMLTRAGLSGAPGTRRAGGVRRVLRGSRPDWCDREAAGLGIVRAMDHAAGVAVLHHQAPGRAAEVPSMEGRSSRC